MNLGRIRWTWKQKSFGERIQSKFVDTLRSVHGPASFLSDLFNTGFPVAGLSCSLIIAVAITSNWLVPFCLLGNCGDFLLREGPQGRTFLDILRWPFSFYYGCMKISLLVHITQCWISCHWLCILMTFFSNIFYTSMYRSD